MSILITGGAGFIGLNFIKYLKYRYNEQLVVVDKMGYASNPVELESTGATSYRVDLADKFSLSKVFAKHKFSTIIHFAAESHVDNSIKNALPFVESNVLGTVNLLDCAVGAGIGKFIHISTDEVFEEVALDKKFNEQTPIGPRNPYSASKAAAEHFVVAYGNTHRLPYIIINSSNNYGPWQHHEKLIPQTIRKVIAGQPVPVYGDGQQIRDWIYVDDTCKAIWAVYNSGALGGRYCIGGGIEVKNIDLVKSIINSLGASHSLIQYVADRPGHDVRYATDISMAKATLGWLPEIDLNLGLDKTIEWTLKNENRI